MWQQWTIPVPLLEYKYRELKLNQSLTKQINSRLMIQAGQKLKGILPLSIPGRGGHTKVGLQTTETAS